MSELGGFAWQLSVQFCLCFLEHNIDSVFSSNILYWKLPLPNRGPSSWGVTRSEPVGETALYIFFIYVIIWVGWVKYIYATYALVWLFTSTFSPFYQCDRHRAQFGFSSKQPHLRQRFLNSIHLNSTSLSRLEYTKGSKSTPSLMNYTGRLQRESCNWHSYSSIYPHNMLRVTTMIWQSTIWSMLPPYSVFGWNHSPSLKKTDPIQWIWLQVWWEETQLARLHQHHNHCPGKWYFGVLLNAYIQEGFSFCKLELQWRWPSYLWDVIVNHDSHPGQSQSRSDVITYINTVELA